jgi:hypothetical protein
MAQCECIAESTRVRCSRDAKPKSKFCWQHSKKCNRTIGLGSIKSPIPVTTGPVLSEARSKRSIKYSDEALLELDQRYKEIRDEAHRQLLGSEMYQEYREFVKSLEDEFVNVPSFQEYEDMLDFAIQNFEDQYVHEDRDFDSLNLRERRQYLINSGKSLGILRR